MKVFDEKFNQAFRKYQVKGKVISQKDNVKIKALHLFAYKNCFLQIWDS